MIYTVDKDFKKCYCDVWVGEIVSRRDLKLDRILKLLDNVLIEGSYRAKIADFGDARLVP